MDPTGEKSKIAGENEQGPGSFVWFLLGLCLCHQFSHLPELLFSVFVSEDMAKVGSIPVFAGSLSRTRCLKRRSTDCM